MIITRNKNHSIIGQQVPCHLQSRIDHVQPIGVEPAVCLIVFHKAVALVIVLSAVGDIFLHALRKIVFVDKVTAGVVRRIDIDHLDLAQIGLLQQFEHVEVVSLYIKILRVVKVHALLFARTQRRRDGRVGEQLCLALVRPCHLIALLPLVDKHAAHFLFELVKVHGKRHLAVSLDFRHAFREQCPDLCDVLLHSVHAHHVHLFHFNCSPFCCFSLFLALLF